MNKEDFKILLGSYGADLMRWPESVRDSAIPLFAHYPALVEEAAEMDALLDGYPLEPVGPEVLRAVMAGALAAENDNQPPRWAQLAMLTACAIFGFWCGNVSLSAGMPKGDAAMKSMLLGPTKLSEVML